MPSQSFPPPLPLRKVAGNFSKNAPRPKQEKLCGPSRNIFHCCVPSSSSRPGGVGGGTSPPSLIHRFQLAAFVSHLLELNQNGSASETEAGVIYFSQRKRGKERERREKRRQSEGTPLGAALLGIHDLEPSGSLAPISPALLLQFEGRVAP